MTKRNRMVLAAGMAAMVMVGSAPGASHEGGDHEAPMADQQTALQTTMEELGGAFKKLARAMRAPDAADIGMYQEQAALIKKHAVKAKGLVPMLAEEAGEKKDAMTAAYQKSMTEFIALVDNLQIVLAEGDLAKAQTVVNKLNEARKKGHENFKKPDEG